jgi:hypothetical protein
MILESEYNTVTRTRSSFRSILSTTTPEMENLWPAEKFACRKGILPKYFQKQNKDSLEYILTYFTYSFLGII